MPRQLYVMGVTPFSLFATRCPCGELTVHGFYHQLTVEKDAPRKRATVAFPCAKCGAVAHRVFRLTTSPFQRRRLLPWLRWHAWLSLHVPARWWRPSVRIAMWLERHLPI